MNMGNIQNLMREAQKMQKQLEKTQKELEGTSYEGNSELVSVVLNGDMSLKKIKINLDEQFSTDDVDILEDMVLVAFNDAVKKLKEDKEKKLGKYGAGLSGLM